MIHSLFVDLVIRVILIIALTDTIIFYILMKKPQVLTPLFIVEIIIITIVPLVISLWFDLIYLPARS